MERKTVTTNLFWRLAERFGAQGVTLIVSIILARLLDTAVYATLEIVTIIITILQVFLDVGFSNALIQKKDADDLDFSSVFYFNIASSAIVYLGLFFLSPLIASYYNMPELTDVIRVLGLTLVVFSLKSVQQAYVTRHMMFRTFFFATLGGTIGAAVVGIVMAYLGCGVWALVMQHLFNMIVDTVILWFMVKWRPKAIFSWARLKQLLSYGWKLLASGLLDTVYNSLNQLVIGKMYTPNDLSFYSQGKKYTEIFVTNINSSIDSVLFPTMSNEQDNPEKVKKITSRAIKTSTYLLMPIMMGLAVCAEPLVRLVMTEKWVPCVPYMRVFCFVFAFYPVHTANLNAIKALGRSDILLKLEVAKKIVGITATAITIWFGPMAIACGLPVTSVISQLLNASPNGKLIAYPYKEQLKDMLPQIILSLIMGALVYCVTFLQLSEILTLLIQMALGVFIYVGASIVTKNDSFLYILSAVKQGFKKTHN